MKKILEKEIGYLNLDKKVEDILQENAISTINELYKLSRNMLKNMGMDAFMINQIIIKLQLNGIDLNGKIYNNFCYK